MPRTLPHPPPLFSFNKSRLRHCSFHQPSPRPPPPISAISAHTPPGKSLANAFPSLRFLLSPKILSAEPLNLPHHLIPFPNLEDLLFSLAAQSFFPPPPSCPHVPLPPAPPLEVIAICPIFLSVSVTTLHLYPSPPRCFVLLRFLLLFWIDQAFFWPPLGPRPLEDLTLERPSRRTLRLASSFFSIDVEPTCDFGPFLGRCGALSPSSSQFTFFNCG